MTKLKQNKLTSFFESKSGVALLSLLIFGVVTLNIFNLYGPIIVPDEVGYWSTGYYFAGTSWNGVVGSSCSYYGWGYGILLAFISLIPVGSVMKYRIAIAINALLLVGVFHIMRKVAGAVFKDASQAMVNLGAFLTVLFTANIYYSQTTYCETLLLFLFWLTILLIYKTTVNSKWWLLILLAGVTSYSYAVHNRMLILLVSVSLVVFFLLLCKKVKLIHAALYFVVLLVGFVVVNKVKNHLTATLFLNNSVASSTGLAERTGLLSQLFDIEFWRVLFTNTIGELFYSNTSTFFLFSVGVVIAVKNIWEVVRKRTETTVNSILCIFVFISFLGMLAISVFSLATPGRLDHIVYGRYIDFTLTPLVLIGFINIRKISNKTKINMIVIWLVELLVAINMVNAVSYIDPAAYAVPGIFLSQALGIFTSNIINIFWGSFLIATLFFAASMDSKFKPYILAVILVVINVGSALFVAKSTLYKEQTENQSLRVDFVEQNIEYFNNEESYYLINDTTYVSWLRFKLKYHMPYEELYTVESADFEIIPNGALVIIATNRDYNSYLTRQLVKIGYGNEEFELYRKVSDE